MSSSVVGDDAAAPSAKRQKTSDDGSVVAAKVAEAGALFTDLQKKNPSYSNSGLWNEAITKCCADDYLVVAEYCGGKELDLMQDGGPAFYTTTWIRAKEGKTIWFDQEAYEALQHLVAVAKPIPKNPYYSK